MCCLRKGGGQGTLPSTIPPCLQTSVRLIPCQTEKPHPSLQCCLFSHALSVFVQDNNHLSLTVWDLMLLLKMQKRHTELLWINVLHDLRLPAVGQFTTGRNPQHQSPFQLQIFVIQHRLLKELGRCFIGIPLISKTTWENWPRSAGWVTPFYQGAAHVVWR